MSQLLLVLGREQGGLVDLAEIGFQRRLRCAGFAGIAACSGGVFTLRRGHVAAPWEWGRLWTYPTSTAASEPLHSMANPPGCAECARRSHPASRTTAAGCVARWSL